MRFLEKSDELFTIEMRERYFDTSMDAFLSVVKGEVEKKVESLTTGGKVVADSQVQTIVEDTVNSKIGEWEKSAKGSLSLEECRVAIKQHESKVDATVKAVLGKVSISPKCMAAIMELLASMLSKATLNELNSGVVIAGFGE